MGVMETNAVSASPSCSWFTEAPYPVMTPRFSSRLTRWCTAEVESPVALPRSVKDIRPSAASSCTIVRSVSSTPQTLASRRPWMRRLSPVASDKRLMVLDSASMYFRAFFGVPEVTAEDGTPVNAVRGFLDFISRLVGDYRPSDLVCAWDNDWRPQWRVDLLPSYKAHRVVKAIPGPRPDIEEVPDPLEIQVPLIREVLGAAGICVVGADGYEADDVIGTLATGASMPVDIVTGDRDLFQLVDDARGVRVLYIARGVGNHERMTAEVVVGKYRVLPSQYADFATMRGDASDGLPGVAGIGEKTAASLLLKFGDL